MFALGPAGLALATAPGETRAAEPGLLIPPMLTLAALIALCVVLLFSWVREHGMLARQRVVRALHTLGEDLLAPAAPAETLRKLREVISGVLDVTGVRLYLYDGASRRLERVTDSGETVPLSIDPDAPDPGVAVGVAHAFRSRTTLSVPDVRRSALFPPEFRTRLPRSFTFVPMLARNECMGVLELHHTGRTGTLSIEERSAVEHLANQAAAVWKSGERQAMREERLRAEKVAASARLIAEAVSQLRAPANNLLMVSERLLGERDRAGVERDLRVVAAEARRAWEVVERLAAFEHTGSSGDGPVEVNSFLAALIDARERDGKGPGVDLRRDAPGEPLRTTAGG